MVVRLSWAASASPARRRSHRPSPTPCSPRRASVCAACRSGSPELTRHLAPPAQRVLDLDRKAALGLPAELVPGLGNIADQLGRIARPPGAYGVRHGAAGDPRGLGDNLPHAVARAAAEVQGFMQAAFRRAAQPVERPEMSIR